jgi:hypothetical protein
LVIPERLVPIEGIDGDIHLPNPFVAVDEFMRAAAAMRVEIKDEHGAGACVERRRGGEDKAIERAESRSAGSPRVVKPARERARNAADAECLDGGSYDPPVEAHTISQSVGSQWKPWDWASSRGLKTGLVSLKHGEALTRRLRRSYRCGENEVPKAVITLRGQVDAPSPLPQTITPQPEPDCSNPQLLDSLNATPLTRRLAILTASIIETEPQATPACKTLISIAAVMAEHLNAEQRSFVAYYMHAQALALDTRILN